MRLQTNEIKHKQGDKCPACHSTDSNKHKGILITKQGKFGIFLSCSQYPDCKYSCNAVKSDRRKHKGKKTRRGKRKTKTSDPSWRKKVEEAMLKHQEEKKARRVLAEHWQQANILMEKE